MSEQQQLTINEKTLTFEKGETVIEVAKRHGIEIPYYCWHPNLSIAANCRMCLVDVEGARAPSVTLHWLGDRPDVVRVRGRAVRRRGHGMANICNAGAGRWSGTPSFCAPSTKAGRGSSCISWRRRRRTAR